MSFQPIISGQTVSGSLDADASAGFQIQVAATEKLVIRLDGPDGADFDLYLRFGKPPTNGQYDQCSRGGSSKEKIELASTEKGDYFAMNGH